MQLSPEQQQALEQQKAQCPFCKIIKGEIPAKKVFEDELFVIVLDINPAARGHMLLVPKEHYPIMPVIPPPVLAKLFELTQEASRLCYTAMVTHGSTAFIANGAAAGQQSAHFLMHVIPREKNDGLGTFDVPKKSMAEDPKFTEALRHNISALMRQQFGSARDIPPPQPPKKEYIKGIIEMNKPLLELVLGQPAQFKKLVEQNQQLKELFRDKNVDEIMKEIQHEHATKREHDDMKKKSDALGQEEKKNHQTEKALDAEFEEVKKALGSEKNEEKKEDRSEKTKKKEEKADLDTIAKLFA
ncbi:MAG: HIT domain-containing protein [Candidatus Woesearchaeota archaeon]|nr:HIT domain-containing protein [Candidatus Woesearchaeota archaeon]